MSLAANVGDTMSHLTECKRSGEWCGECYAGLQGRAAYRGHFGHRPAIFGDKEDDEMSMQRRTATSDRGMSLGKAAACEMSRRLPTLFEFLTVTQWPDGAERVPATVLLCWEDGRWKMWLSDKDAALTCWVTAETLSGVLASAEAAIEGDAGDWRPARGVKLSGKRRG